MAVDSVSNTPPSTPTSRDISDARAERLDKLRAEQQKESEAKRLQEQREVDEETRKREQRSADKVRGQNLDVTA